MSIVIRAYQPSDREFILSLVSRFAEFQLPEWRSAEEIDQTNWISMEQALQQSAPGSAIFVAEDDNGLLAGFIHLQTETDYFNHSKYGYISDLAVEKSFEGRGTAGLYLRLPRNGHAIKATSFLLYTSLRPMHMPGMCMRDTASGRK